MYFFRFLYVILLIPKSIIKKTNKYFDRFCVIQKPAYNRGIYLPNISDMVRMRQKVKSLAE